MLNPYEEKLKAAQNNSILASIYNWIPTDYREIKTSFN